MRKRSLTRPQICSTANLDCQTSSTVRNKACYSEAAQSVVFLLQQLKETETSPYSICLIQCVATRSPQEKFMKGREGDETRKIYVRRVHRDCKAIHVPEILHQKNLVSNAARFTGKAVPRSTCLSAWKDRLH